MDVKKQVEYLAELQCDRCKVRKWVPFDKRFSGTSRAAHDRAARCDKCPFNYDYMTWTGRIDVRDP